MTTWRQRLIAAKKRGKFTRRDRLAAMEFSHCAVGERLKIQNMEYSAPEEIFDRIGLEAYDLGIEFYGYIIADDVQSAIQLYHRIRQLRVKK